MIRSEAGKFIFVHVQKSAGISIETVLKNNFSDAQHWHGRHGHAKTGIQEIGQKKWETYYSFAFVRNPWDRMVSWYSMVQKELTKLPIEQQKSNKPFNSPFWNQVITDSHDFSSFLHNCTEIVFDRGCFKSYAFNQIDYLLDESGKLVVDFIGRFENLVADTSTVFNHLGIKNFNLPKQNISRHNHYSDYYTKETQELIAKRFKKDIEMFGYQF